MAEGDEGIQEGGNEGVVGFGEQNVTEHGSGAGVGDGVTAGGMPNPFSMGGGVPAPTTPAAGVPTFGGFPGFESPVDSFQDATGRRREAKRDRGEEERGRPEEGLSLIHI